MYRQAINPSAQKKLAIKRSLQLNSLFSVTKCDLHRQINKIQSSQVVSYKCIFIKAWVQHIRCVTDKLLLVKAGKEK
jgi:hypothetical protein